MTLPLIVPDPAISAPDRALARQLKSQLLTALIAENDRLHTEIVHRDARIRELEHQLQWAREVGRG